MSLIDVLKTGRTQIIRRWMADVRRAIPELDSLSDSELEDSFPLLLDRIAHRLGGGELPPVLIESRLHAELRWSQGIGLPAMMLEYHLIHRAIKGVVVENLGRNFDPTEETAIDEVWFQAIKQGVIAHAACKEAELWQGNEHHNRLLATLAHDVRTPLQSIVMTVAVMEMKLASHLDAEDRDRLDSAKAAVNAILDLHRGILGQSKLDAGRVVLDETTFSLDPVLAACALVIKPLAAHKGLAVIEDLATDLAVRTDKAIVEQVLGNLLSNAVRFTQRGRVAIRSRADAGGIRIEVEDTGVGIAPEDQCRIFDEFFQAIPSRPGNGFGLGLAIARRMAKLLGGDVTVQSVPGKGSTFTLMLPLSIQASP